MAEKSKTSDSSKSKTQDRDKTLINILERMVGQMQKQDLLLEDMTKQLNELSRDSEGARLHRVSLQNRTENSNEKLGESISRFRSDMLSLVNEQDHISKGLENLSKLVKTATFSLEDNNRRIEDLDELVRIQEKSVRNHYEHSLKQAEAYTRELADSRRNFTKLHAETEKRLGQLNYETQQQLARLQQETTRRLLALDGIDSALHILLERTEPPEKKPFIFVRLFHRSNRFFRIKLPLAVKRICVRRNKKSP